MHKPEIVSAQEWQSALTDVLVAEKQMTRARDALAARRRRMPWTSVDKDYRFDGPGGPATLLDLFAGRRQLIVYRAFMDPDLGDWPDHGCVGCSLMADHIGNLAHLNARDTTLVYVSRGPQTDIARLQDRMGWDIPWYTIIPDERGAFDVDFGVDQWHGTNAFIRWPDDDGERVYRTYFINNRGDEAFVNTWAFLDVTALGRQETWEDSPEGHPQSAPYAWWRWHDTYDRTGAQQVAELYQETQARIADLLGASPVSIWNRPVPACPGWTVRDVVSHMRAVAEDWADGRLSGAPSDEQTAEHTRRFAGLDAPELLDGWSRATARLRRLADTTGLEPPLGDIACHEHDIRAAIDRPGARDAPSVDWTADRLLSMLAPPVPLRVVVEDRAYRTGPPDGEEIVLRTTAFEALRWRTGRRSRAQLAAMDWSADPAPVIEHLCLFGPATETILE